MNFLRCLGQWRDPVDVKNTKKLPFFTERGQTIQTETMCRYSEVTKKFVILTTKTRRCRLPRCPNAEEKTLQTLLNSSFSARRTKQTREIRGLEFLSETISLISIHLINLLYSTSIAKILITLEIEIDRRSFSTFSKNARFPRFCL